MIATISSMILSRICTTVVEINLKISSISSPPFLKDCRVNKDTVPDGVYCYEMRHGDEGDPCTIEQNVVVNYYGAIFVLEPFEFGEKDYVPVDFAEFGFVGEWLTLDEFMNR